MTVMQFRYNDIQHQLSGFSYMYTTGREEKRKRPETLWKSRSAAELIRIAILLFFYSTIVNKSEIVLNVAKIHVLPEKNKIISFLDKYMNKIFLDIFMLTNLHVNKFSVNGSRCMFNSYTTGA